MNIAIFTDTYPPQINGVATSTRMLEKELIALGHTVYIFTASDPNAVNDPPHVFRMPSMPFVFLPSHRFALLYPPKLLLKMRSLKIDVIHTQTEFPLGIFGVAVAGFLRVPQVHTYHTMYEDYVHYVAGGHLITPKMAQQYSRIFCNRMRAVIAPVEKARESLLEYGVERPIRVIPTGIDFEPFSREKYSQADIDEVKHSLGLSLTDPVVVSVGRVAKEKSIDVVLGQFPKLLEKLPDAKFVLVGGGPILDELKAQAKELGIADSVVFTGPQPWDSIGKYYQLGDVFVSASTSETQGLTYIESMAAKVLVCAKKDKSIEGVVIDEQTGYCFSEEEELPDVLYRALTNTAKRTEIIETAFAHIRHMSSRNFAKSVEALYSELLSAFPPPRKRYTHLHHKHTREL